jgi:Kef-type K+ transport system membrane component KefB
MNGTLEPREVDKPFARRWLRTTLLLLLRSPFRFGLLIALLGCLDTSAVNLAKGYVVQKLCVDRLGNVMLPLLWVLVSAVARGADDPRLTWQALAQLRRRRVWIGALVPGVGVALANSIIYVSLGASRHSSHSQSYLLNQGQLLDSVESSVMLISIIIGICYFPLLVFVPDVSALHAGYLSRKATDMNGWNVITLLILILVLGAIALSTLPSYGMTTAAFLVFIGALNYVAYREIFEGRLSPELPAQTPSRSSVPLAQTAGARNQGLPE